MCVIIAKPAGTALPPMDILKACHEANPHGCGFASPSHDFKSLNFATFVRELRKVKKDEPCIIHFRLATNGSICRENCHPFRQENVWFAHNGILDVEAEGDLTDSETAFKNTIFPAIRRYGWCSPEAEMVISSVIGGSRFALLQGASLALYGDFQRRGGCYYSNLRFEWYLDTAPRYEPRAFDIAAYRRMRRERLALRQPSFL